MAILSINSHVAFGHVGNSAAVLPLQCLGHEVWPVHTTLLSNHPGHGRWRGGAVEARRVAEVLDGIADGGAFASVEAVLTGYLGSVDTGEAALTAVTAVKGANPAALYCCDPVIGDGDEGLYVEDTLARWFGERAVAAADIVTPNRFELAHLTGRPAATEAEALAAARALIERGPGLVVATSIPTDGGGKRVGAGVTVASLAVTAAGAWKVTTPRLASRAKGAGDVLAALFVGHTVKGADAGAALELAVSSVFGLIAAAGGSSDGEPARDLPLVAARAEITQPSTRFYAERLD